MGTAGLLAIMAGSRYGSLREVADLNRVKVHFDCGKKGAGTERLYRFPLQ